MLRLTQHSFDMIYLLTLGYMFRFSRKTLRKATTTVELTPLHIPAAHDILKPRHSDRGVPVVETNVDQAIATNQS